jgi:hypothetical protein
MHHHLEIVLPPVEDIETAVAQILKPFDENGQDEDGHRNSHAFWDFYVIGGRWAGAKLEAMLDQPKLEQFKAELASRKVTVSGLQFGKQELSPASQIPLVDALWNEFFPDSPIKVCPLFKHFNDQYQNSEGFPDIMRLAGMPKSLTASHVIIAGPGWQDDGSLEAKYMLQTSIWNGVTHVDAKWDGSVLAAIEEHKKRLEDYKPEYIAKASPTDDWLVVTVDYHS